MLLPILFVLIVSQSVISDEDVRDFNLYQLLHLFGQLLQFRPGDVRSEDVTFFLHTRTSSNVQIPPESSTGLDLTKTTKMIIHGWTDNHNRSWYHHMTDAFLKKGDFNVIQVDWARVAQSDYTSAAYNTRLVGKYVAKFILAHELPPKTTHLIGHSFGAHVAAVAAQMVKDSTGTRIGRITGLDAAANLFRFFKPKRLKLDRDDADVVDFFHSDGLVLGYYKPRGTFDVYLNGGTRRQPECTIGPGNFTTPGAVWEIIYCSHRSSYVRFTEIIDDYEYTCHKCKSLIEHFEGRCRSNQKYVFGAEDIDETMTGVCFVDTNTDKIKV